MKMVISPAKSLNFESNLPTEKNSNPYFLAEANRINELIKDKSPSELSKLMKISDKLGNLNWKRNQNFKTPFNKQNARPAIYTFDGDVYTGLDAYTIGKEKWDTLNSSLRILSGLYGVLKPFDLMQPYRLEMGTSFSVNGSKNLYGFWQEKITAQLNSELQSDELVVNLASKEYASAVSLADLDATVIEPVFKDYKNGNLKIISFYSKKARGLMARYLIDNNSKTSEDVLGFAINGYRYSEEHTVDPTKPVFVR